MCAHPVRPTTYRSTASARCGETAVEQLAKVSWRPGQRLEQSRLRCSGRLADAGDQREAGGASRCHSISRRHERGCELRFDVELPAGSQQGVRRRAAPQLLPEHRRAVDGRFDQRREARVVRGSTACWRSRTRPRNGGRRRARVAGSAATPRTRSARRRRGAAAAIAASGSRVRSTVSHPGGSSGSPSASVIPRLARKSRTPSSRGRAWRCA